LLDVTALAQQAGELPGVTWAGHAGYWCLPGGLERMKTIVAEKRLERVLIAGCAPRTHEHHFRRALEGDVNPALIHVTNLRDLCARPHQADPAAAQEKAGDQVRMAVADLAARQAGPPRVASIVPHAVVIGGGMAGMTAALGVSDAGIPVTLIERESELGGLARLWPDDQATLDLVAERIASVRARPNVQVLTGTQVTNVNGSVGRYQVVLSGGQVIEAGAILIATGARPNQPFSALRSPVAWLNYAFVLCDMTPERWQTCWRACCLTTFRQAAQIKRQSPEAKVTIFFRELYTAGGAYDELVWEAQRLGVEFVRYPAGQPPQLIDGEIFTRDQLTGQRVVMPCDLFIDATAMSPQVEAADLAMMLRLPIDASGFIPDVRLRLRPADRIERGIYVCGAVHFPGDAQRAMFEAYSAAARAARHIQSGQIVNWTTAARVDATRCNGCGDCARVCPFMAVTMRVDMDASRQGDKGTRLAVVDRLLCTGCGNCVSVCPVKAVQVPSASDEQIEAQIRAALGIAEDEGHPVTVSPCHHVTLSPRHLILACEWSGYSAAEIAGARGLSYPVSTRIIRLNCTGRLQPGLMLKALEMGATGVLILGCAPGLCHYEQGNERCAAAFEQAHALANLLALDDRIKLEWVPPDDGARFVQVVGEFVKGRGTNDRCV